MINRLCKLAVLIFLMVFCMACAEEGESKIQFQQMHFVDSTNSFSINEITRRENWIKDNSVINLGFTKYPCWVRLIIDKSAAKLALWKLKMTYPIIDSLSFYQKSTSGEWQEILSGELVIEKPNVTTDRSYAFELEPSFLIDTVYMRVKTEGAMHLPLKIDNNDDPALQNQFLEKLYGAYFGALLVMIFFNLALFLVLKDQSFMLYVIFILLQGGCHLFFTGHHILFLPRWMHPYFNIVLLALMFGCNIFASLFSIRFLDIKKYNITLYRIMLGLVYASLCFIPIIMLVGYRIAASYLSFLFLITPLTLLLAGIVCWREKQVYARYFTISWLMFLISVVLLSLRTLGLIDGKYNMEVMVQIGSILDVILLGIALGERYNTFRQEKNKALKKSLEYSQILERQTLEQNKILEEKIKERTYELEESRNKIEDQNAILSEYSTNLEQEVNQRTSDLTHLVEELQLHIRNFDHYSYIVSHNLRSPVAQIQGLVNILERENLSEHNLDIVNHLTSAATSLDVIVSDLNNILDIKNGKGITFEIVDLLELVNEFKKQNEQLIKENNIRFSMEMKFIQSVYTVRLYMRSILDNLLSNAIKYRHPERTAQINISTYRNKENIIIWVSDNGIGIDLNRFSNKIFGLYQRFATDTDVDGRGLGLYMVKAQVEFLKGKIIVASNLGQGTTFEITLPLNG